MLEMQRKFSNSYFDPTGFSDEDLIEKHKTFCLALHSEVSQLADAVHYKEHRKIKTDTSRQKILYESVDVMRYVMAAVNLWGFTSDEFIDAFDSRDASLWDKKNRSLADWSQQKTVIVDVDDVLARFRKGFFGWLNTKHGLNITTDYPDYYYSGPVGDMTGEEAFSEFISEGGFRTLEVNKNVLSSLKVLREQGYWIQLLTARPAENLKCMYDTYWWLENNNIPYDNLSFSFEKYRWLSDKPFYTEGKVVAAIDDSPKHAAEYAAQGVKVLVPKRTYNKQVWEAENIITFNWENEPFEQHISD